MNQAEQGEDILVVDDDADIRDAVAELLVAEGYRVRTASNGAEALERLHTALPSLVLLDLMMPVMSGWQVLEQLEAEGVSVPVCVISAVASSYPLKSAHVLSKPFDGALLLEIVGKYRSSPVQ